MSNKIDLLKYRLAQIQKLEDTIKECKLVLASDYARCDLEYKGELGKPVYKTFTLEDSFFKDMWKKYQEDASILISICEAKIAVIEDTFTADTSGNIL